MRRMPQERPKQPRRHLVCYMQIMVPRKMSQYVQGHISLLCGSPRHWLDMCPLFSTTTERFFFLRRLGEGIYTNRELISPQELEAKRINSRKGLLLCHLNINSIQNKFDELIDVIHKLKVHVIIIGETKIDSTYPNSQFNVARLLAVLQ